jgi:hypothetical protein
MHRKVVGSYVHAYDSPRRPAFRPVPAARTSQETLSGTSATPIYDALCAEYVRSYRTLPGDRSGEEELRFTGFGDTPRHHTTGTSTYGSPATHGTYGSYGAFSAGAHGARRATAAQQTHSATAVWQPGSRHTTVMHHVPAALPPGPRRAT